MICEALWPAFAYGQLESYKTGVQGFLSGSHILFLSFLKVFPNFLSIFQLQHVLLCVGQCGLSVTFVTQFEIFKLQSIEEYTGEF